MNATVPATPERRFYVTFGQRYRREPHPHLPDWACHPDGWLEIEVLDDPNQAWDLAKNVVGVVNGALACSSIYERGDFEPDCYPRGCQGIITATGELHPHDLNVEDESRASTHSADCYLWHQECAQHVIRRQQRFLQSLDAQVARVRQLQNNWAEREATETEHLMYLELKRAMEAS